MCVGGHHLQSPGFCAHLSEPHTSDGPESHYPPFQTDTPAVQDLLTADIFAVDSGNMNREAPDERLRRVPLNGQPTRNLFATTVLDDRERSTI